MNPRQWIIGSLAAIGLVSLAAVIAQYRQVATLRAEREQLAAVQPPVNSNSAAGDDAAHSYASATAPMAELLELRGKVTRLMAQKRELEGARLENERLRTELANRATNVSTAIPPGYIRASQAQWVGLNTPENTLQSFLFALRNRDLTHLLQTLTPKSAQRIAPHAEAFLQDAAQLPGMQIVTQISDPDGSLRVRVEFMPGREPHEWMTLLLVDGQWRIELP